MPISSITRSMVPLTLFVFLMFSLAGCSDTASTETSIVPPTIVSIETVAELAHLTTTVTYPGVVAADQDADVVATAGGTAGFVGVHLGDTVTAGQTLVRIDDANAGSATATSIAQAELAVRQARSSLDLARRSYTSLAVSTEKDLAQAKATTDQAGRNVDHANTSADDTLRSAELAYESAQLATTQAKTTLDNRRILATQSLDDATTNALQTATTYAATAGSVIDGINAITGFDDRNNATVSYTQYLGALDATTKTRADSTYDTARTTYIDITSSAACQTAEACLARTSTLLTAAKTAIDATVTMLERTVSGGDLPQTSATGTSLTSLKSTAVGYQSSINAAITAVNAAKQTLTNTKLNNTTTIDQLEQVYALAQKQEAAARQSLTTAQSATATQRDQTATGASTATSSYEALQVRLQSQLDSSRTAVNQAEIAYQNAEVALQNLTNNRVITSPIEGQITQVNVTTGDAVTMGRTLFVVSKTGNVKVTMYVDAVHQSLIAVGTTATITDSSRRAFTGHVSRVAPEPDALSRRFLVELQPDAGQTDFPRAGGVVDVAIAVTYQPLGAKNFFVPLAAVTIGQNERSLFTAVDSVAKRASVSVARVVGEYAEVTADLAPTTPIIIDGARSVSEGTTVTTTAALKAANERTTSSKMETTDTK